MDMKLTGKRALVTGANSGIGAAIATQLPREGVRVVVHGRDRNRTQAVVDKITGAGGEAVAVLGDLTVDESAQAVIEAAMQAFGGIDILVNNAGGAVSAGNASWFDATLDEWANSYRFNTLAAVRLIQALVPDMRTRGWGRLIQISSRNAISPHAQFGDYGAAKAALNNVTLSLSKALAGTGVTANGIMPGLIHTPALDSWFVEMAKKHAGTSNPQDGQDFVLRNVVNQTVGRLGQPQDIANAVVYLASPLSDFINGTTFRIDGGATPTV